MSIASRIRRTLAEERWDYAPHEAPVMPGSPGSPAHPGRRRAAYIAVAVLLGLTGGLGNALVAVNTGVLAGSLGLDPVEVAWLPTVYVMTNVFDGGRLAAQEDAATARRDQAAYAYRRAALTAFREVDDALAGVRRTAEQATALDAQVAATRGAVDNAGNRYRAGYSSYIEQLDAQRSLLGAQLSLVQASANRLTSYIAPQRALSAPRVVRNAHGQIDDQCSAAGRHVPWPRNRATDRRVESMGRGR